jgi:DNA helicase HerA-like ATPase
MRHEAVTIGNLKPITADSPIPFDSRELLDDRLFYLSTARFRGQERIQEYIATLRLRIHRQLSDKRWTAFTKHTEDDLLTILNAMVGEPEAQVVVIDCSLLGHDVLPFFCAIIGRVILELRTHANPAERITQPYVIVLEEAHNYLRPSRESESAGLTLSREAFERIAKEGRKYGLSLIIASQRPSDVSPTVLSQCANFLVHRVQNPEDLDYFKKILPTGSRELLDQLPILAPGEAILLGSGVNVPARVLVRLPKPKPESETPRPWESWKTGQPKFDVESSVANWRADNEGQEPNEA